MATTTHIPLDLYLRTAYEPDAEYIDGEVEERPKGEDSHSAWQAAIQRWFFRYENEWDIVVCPELRVQTSPTHFRVPDVTILDATFPRERVVTHPPAAVLEILSPEDTHQRLMRKLREYERMGIAAIWVIDPDTGFFERFESGQLVRRSEFNLPARGIEFSVSEIARLVR